ncbi:hypothetical protein [Streptomyces subrutilus]|uniref:hypothetical protein n=1 Tax=Streptomyces subrutilus TaxID=36818 RepID=UPI002E126E4C|nr:hypothetical protein OG479_27965 [Streptomyces subrutilus]
MSATLLGNIARTSEPEVALRRVLGLDAFVTGLCGLAYAAFPVPLGRLLGIGPALLLELGVFLALFGAGVGWLATRGRPPVLPVRLVVGANAAWTALSLAAPVLWLSPTPAGAVWTAAQSGVVAALGGLQWLAVRSGASAE